MTIKPGRWMTYHEELPPIKLDDLLIVWSCETTWHAKKDCLTYSGTSDEFCYDFSVLNDLTQVVHFPTRIPGCGSHSPALLDSFLSSDLVFGLQWLSLHQEILIMLLSQFPLTFHHIHNGMPHFITLLMTILVLIGLVIMIIWEMFRGRISLNSVPLLLLVGFVSGFWLELMCIFLIRSIRSSLTYLHGFQLLVLLP